MVEYNEVERKRYTSWQFKEFMKSLGCQISDMITIPQNGLPYVVVEYKITYGHHTWGISWPLCCTECHGFDLYGCYMGNVIHKIGDKEFNRDYQHMYLDVNDRNLSKVEDMFKDIISYIKAKDDNR